ncbi:MAG: DUF512 domain-containing protein [Candidatus Sumerlaeia bacterium]|nr:DUF512 domain-containing protein [Candidatus Sumerlaeia bacterium]
MSPGVLITKVEPAGAAARIGLRAGDRLLSLNGHPLGDQIDVQFYSAARRLRVKWLRNGVESERGVCLRPGEGWGWELEPFAPRRCNNRCPFCFVLQLPRGLRRALYFRDEDYRLSFLYGHYITGTNLMAGDLERIVRQRLSPLYISVHATDPQLRARLLGRTFGVPPITELLDFLAAHDIQFHAQIVVCPDWNDGAALLQTLADLRRYHPALRSVAVVPVGLTAHRAHLPRIRPVTPRYAAATLELLAPIMRQWQRALGERVLFAADEWYLRAGLPAPDYRGVDIAPQFENGVGMVGQFLRPWRQIERRLPRRLPSGSVAVVTGVSASVFLKPIVRRLNKIAGLRVRLIVVCNRLFGPTVTVSGLLAGRDILDALLSCPRADRYLLPANCLRPWDHLFLDDLSLEQMADRLGKPVVPVEGTCRELVSTVFCSADFGRSCLANESISMIVRPLPAQSKEPHP